MLIDPISSLPKEGETFPNKNCLPIKIKNHERRDNNMTEIFDGYNHFSYKTEREKKKKWYFILQVIIEISNFHNEQSHGGFT